MLKIVRAHVENSLELIRCIQAGDLTTNKALPYPCSLDVVSLYTTIATQEAITNATDRIQNPILNLSKQDVSDLLQVTLNNMYFSFRDQDFRQREGLPMGSSISGILAILFIDKLGVLSIMRKFRKFRSKRKWNGSAQVKFSGQSGPPPEVVIFDRSVQSDRKLPFHFQKFSVAVPLQLVTTIKMGDGSDVSVYEYSVCKLLTQDVNFLLMHSCTQGSGSKAVHLNLFFLLVFVSF